MEIIKNQKGGIKILFEEYVYTKKATKPTRIRWECSQRTFHSCKGAITTNLEMSDIRFTSGHSHPANENFTEACKLRQSLKDMAQKTRDDPARLLAQATSNVQVETRLEVGKSESVRRTLRC